NDSAIVLEQAGRLTRVKRGSGVVRLEPFERVWNTLSILPQRWSFDVTAITQDGIPITYPADIHFQIGDTDEDIFKAATSTWIRDANRTEPDRLMTWDKRIIIGYTEGVLRSILALYTLDQLIDAEQREAVRAELETRLQRAVPNVGAKILQVNLGDIKMQDKEPVPLQQWIQEQWIQAWQVKHDSDITIRLAEGMARGTELEEQARLEIHTDRLDHTTRIMEELARSGAHVPHFILLSLVERIERMRYERGYFLPENLLHLLGSLHAALYPNLVANLPPEPPSASTPTAPT
ncbi:MAG: SPFH domain-containing protein, partial [Chloroflexi bacterium]|nr:SPFH domain-containing protein [Chloroflexota bacterium]